MRLLSSLRQNLGSYPHRRFQSLSVSYSVSSLVPVSVLRPILDTQWTLSPLGVILGGDYREAKEGTKQDLLLSQERKSLGKGVLGHLNHIVLLLCVPPPQAVVLFSIKQGDSSVWSATKKKGEMIA